MRLRLILVQIPSKSKPFSVKQGAPAVFAFTVVVMNVHHLLPDGVAAAFFLHHLRKEGIRNRTRRSCAKDSIMKRLASKYKATK